MVGSAAQVEFAERIKRTVADEFDRVLRAFRQVAEKQSGKRRDRTLEVIAVVERNRSEVMAREEAGYFIHDWQDISDQVRKMIVADAAYPRRLSHREPQE